MGSRNDLPALGFECGEKLCRGLNPNAVSQCGQKVPAVVGHDDLGAGGTRDFGDVRIVDTTTSCAILAGGPKKRHPIAWRDIVYCHPFEDLLLDEVGRIGRGKPVFSGESCGDRKEFEATVPRRR